MKKIIAAVLAIAVIAGVGFTAQQAIQPTQQMADPGRG
jgi:hypothetical protein